MLVVVGVCSGDELMERGGVHASIGLFFAQFEVGEGTDTDTCKSYIPHASHILCEHLTALISIFIL